MNNKFNYSFTTQPANEIITKRCFEDVLRAQEHTNDEFGINFDNHVDDGVPYHLIGPVDITSGNFSLQALVETCKTAKSGTPASRVNLLAYFDVKIGIDSTFDPPTFDATNGVNTIFPDEIIQGWCGPSSQDIFDNIICETIRAKYKPIDLSGEFHRGLAAAQKEKAAIITDISSLFYKYRLFHRAPTDGAILITSEYGPLISQMRTDKATLLTDDFSLAASHDEQANTIKYAGTKPPSSDSPELLMLLELLSNDGKEPQLAVHFHHPTLTRSELLSESITAHEIEYGRFTSGKQIYEELQRINQPWLILKHHGFLWLGDTVEEFEQFLQDRLKLKPIN